MKPNYQTGLLLFTSAGMEISWRLALATLITASISNRLFPVPEAILIFGLAIGLTRAAHGRGWRWITILSLQGVGCALTSLRLLYVSHYHSWPFLSPTWLQALFRPSKSLTQWLFLLFTIFWAFLFWIGGVRLARRPAAYRDVCSQFEAGIGMLFGLFLFKIVLIHDGVQIRDPLSAWLIGPFFLFGLVAMGFARHHSHAPKTYIAGYQPLGILLSVGVLTLVAGTGIFAMLHPYFRLAAEMGYTMLQQGARPFIPILISILRFLLMGRQNPSSGTMPAPENDVPGGHALGESGWWARLLEMVFGWGIGGLVALVAVVGIGFGVWHLIRWLFSKTPAGQQRMSRPGRLRDWLVRLQIALSVWWQWVRRHLRRYTTAAQIYAALLHWGRRSGLPHRKVETPREYGKRLRRAFPAVHSEIALIIDLFQQEVYAELAVNARQFTRARLALRRLRSPALWLSRIRFWFRQNGAPDS